MDAGIEAYLQQLTSIDQDAPGLARLDHTRFNWRPGPDRWSVGQCVEHLNITMDRYLPVLRSAIQDARQKGLVAPGPFTLSLFERWFLRTMEPPARMRTRTPSAFEAPPDLDPEVTLQRYSQLHAGYRECLVLADGLDLRRIKVRSQFGPISWSLNGTFAILLAHERRHIWQAREVRRLPGFPAAT